MPLAAQSSAKYRASSLYLVSRGNNNIAKFGASTHNDMHQADKNMVKGGIRRQRGRPSVAAVLAFLLFLYRSSMTWRRLVIETVIADMRKNTEFDRFWPEMKEFMCPNRRPNQSVWSTLFILARIELGFGLDRTHYIDDAISRFFIYHTGGVLYTSPNGEDRMAYLRVWKAGNNQIRINLEEMLNGSDSSSVMQSSKTISIVGEDGLLDGLSTEQLNRTCIVTAVRDPIEHFLSAYNEIEFRNTPPYMKKRKERRYWNWENPLPYAKHGNGTIERFETFVSDFIGNTHNTGVYATDLVHIFSMSGVLFGLKQIKECTGRDANLDGYLPSLRDLDKEFPKFLQRTCPTVPKLDSFRRKSVHESQLDPDNNYAAAKLSWERQGKVSRALCALHALDYACFDDIPVPGLCQSLYSSDRFRDHLLNADVMESPPICPIRPVHRWAPQLPGTAKELYFETEEILQGVL